MAIGDPTTCEKRCDCHQSHSGTKFIVVTGGPSAGKTAVLEILRKELCQHIAILPEAASIVFGGGFWRLESASARQASQRAILHIQNEMETLVRGEEKWAVALCDRGLLDGLAYWPGDEADFFKVSGLDMEKVYSRYHAVVHLRTPNAATGYNLQNPLRIENAAQAIAIDEKIASVWSKHPRYQAVENAQNFMEKAEKAKNLIISYLPECCAQAVVSKN